MRKALLSIAIEFGAAYSGVVGATDPTGGHSPSS